MRDAIKHKCSFHADSSMYEPIFPNMYMLTKINCETSPSALDLRKPISSMRVWNEVDLVPLSYEDEDTGSYLHPRGTLIFS